MATKKSKPAKPAEDSDIEIGVVNVTPKQFYKKNPCLIAFNYLRLEVTGEVRPCCIAKHPIGELKNRGWREIWRSEAYSAFRKKMLKIQTEHFHIKDPEFLFCQQCSHLIGNVFMNRARNGEML